MDELETMAARIQSGERAKGNKDFWGYVWQGAAAEALTCNAIECKPRKQGEDHRKQPDDQRENPAAIRSWQRAKRWIGWISPRSVLAYQELDSMNAFDQGEAAFVRVWGGASITRVGLFRQVHWRNLWRRAKQVIRAFRGTIGLGRYIGGSGLAVSQHSSHRKRL